MDENREIRVLFEDPDYDAFGDDEKDYFEYSFANNKLMYLQHTTEKRELHFFDKELECIYKKIKAKIGDYEIQFVSIADDYSTILFYKYSDRLEGTSYIYDSKQDKLELLGNSTPWINEKDMAKMKPIEYESRDGLKIHGYLTIPNGVSPQNIPVIVFPHAGPEWRNSWGFNEFVQFFANRGYAVLLVNFRGSEGYGKKFLHAGFRQRGLKIQDDITDGVNWLIEQGIADKNRIGIFGISYGGYSALVGLTLTPELYACGIDFWGITNWFLWYESFPPQWKRYLNEIHRRWINPATDSVQMHQTSHVFHAKNIKAPVFLGQSVNDRRVVYQHSEQMVEELKKRNKVYEYVLLEGEGHALSNEKKLIELMTKVEAFLDNNMSMKN
ncbi:MAG: S9 family peptidase [Bacteroidetes bacterium]|nr:S9 family peptidase [Bacteroidota bacterium]MBU1115356.1 S9 family peptidase [Bacteroidota bacterium]MBU1800512.1 S9 family peptidase [Bacteroidota bacterium]